MNRKHRIYVLILMSFMPIFLASEKPADEIVFGMSGSLSGHFSYYGTTIRNAITACFNRVNKNGGIGGKQLKLMCLDDHASAARTKENIETMNKDHGIDMFLGVMGTRGILSLFSMIQDKKIAMFFPWGGHEKFNNPDITHIINGFGALEPQLDAIITHLNEQLLLKQIALFHADDTFSTSAAQSFAQKLQAKGSAPLATQSYNRFTMDLYPPTDRLIKTDPRTVVCICTSMPAVKLINRFYEKGHYGTRFIGIDSTFAVPSILRTKGASFTYTSIVPNPETSTIQLAQEYREDMKAYFPDDELSVLAFSYYLAASIIIRAIQSINGPINKEEIIKNIERMKNEDIKGYFISFDTSDRYAFGKRVWII